MSCAKWYATACMMTLLRSLVNSKSPRTDTWAIQCAMGSFYELFSLTVASWALTLIVKKLSRQLVGRPLTL